MTAARDAIVAEARSWLGTPFHWQGSVKGIGCDCKGLIVGVARALGLPGADGLYAGIADYQKVDGQLLRKGLGEAMTISANPLPGDVLLLCVAGKAQHLAILTENNRMIHTYGKGPSKVVEVPMGRVWWAALDSVWKWKGIE